MFCRRPLSRHATARQCGPRRCHRRSPFGVRVSYAGPSTPIVNRRRSRHHSLSRHNDVGRGRNTFGGVAAWRQLARAWKVVTGRLRVPPRQAQMRRRRLSGRASIAAGSSRRASRTRAHAAFLFRREITYPAGVTRPQRASPRARRTAQPRSSVFSQAGPVVITVREQVSAIAPALGGGWRPEVRLPRWDWISSDTTTRSLPQVRHVLVERGQIIDARRHCPAAFRAGRGHGKSIASAPNSADRGDRVVTHAVCATSSSSAKCASTTLLTGG